MVVSPAPSLPLASCLGWSRKKINSGCLGTLAGSRTGRDEVVEINSHNETENLHHSPSPGGKGLRRGKTTPAALLCDKRVSEGATVQPSRHGHSPCPGALPGGWGGSSPLSGILATSFLLATSLFSQGRVCALAKNVRLISPDVRRELTFTSA